MSKTIIVVGFGPGISTGVAEKFGAEGFNVALVGRSQERLDAGAAALKAKGVTAAAFTADASNPTDIRAAIARVRAQFGSINAVHWNAYGGFEAGDLLAADAKGIGGIFDVAIDGLLATLQEALPDLKAAGDGALLVTNGAFADLNPQIDEYAVSGKSMGVALANAAKHKLVGLLAVRLKTENVYVGEVMIAGSVKGTAWAANDPNAIDPVDVGAKFWQLYQGRSETYARLPA
jgi:NADP-dependent 3-hydroxy acid dehydrogenase YdfG